MNSRLRAGAMIAAVALVAVALPLSASASGPSGPLADPASLMPDSIFNQNVTNWPVDPNSATLVANFVAGYEANYGSVGVAPRPVYWVPADQPPVPISVQSGCNADGVTSAPIPPWAQPSGGSDSILTIYQPSSGKVWEFWQAHPVATQTTESLDGMPYTVTNDDGWSACWGGEATMATFTGVFPSPYGETATGISNLSVEITEQDIASGAIDHAIGLQITDCNGFVSPAVRGDCGSDPGQPAEGQWFRFPSSVNCADYNATAFEQMVCVAGQTYGFVVDDQGGAYQIQTESPEDYFLEGGTGAPPVWVNFPNGWGRELGGTDPLSASWNTTPGDGSTQLQEYQVVAGLPWDQMQAVDQPSPARAKLLSLGVVRDTVPPLRASPVAPTP